MTLSPAHFGCCLAFPLLLAACAGAKAPDSHATTNRAEPPGPIHHVVLVTMDGMLPDSYLHPDAHGLKIPTLRHVVEHGASSSGALSIFPTVTYPSHTSMVTGVAPGKHGIASNRSFDPMENDFEGWNWYAEDIQRDPIWRIAERAGYKTGMVHWPVSVGADVTWRVPEYWRAKNANDPKVIRAVSTPGLLESVAREHPDLWNRFAPPRVHDDAITQIATHIIAEGKPTLLLVHLVEVDGEQHKHGVWSPEAIAAIENDDRQLAIILEALDKAGMSKDTNVIIASDHGFMDAGPMVKPAVLLREAGLVTVDGNRVVDWKATAVVNSGEAYIYLQNANDAAVQEKVRAIFKAKLQEAGSGIGRLYEASEIRAAGGDPNAFLAIEAAPGFQLGSSAIGDYKAPPQYHGTHGYDPQRPEMRASLLMYGPGVPHGTIPDAHLVDIAPTIAQWLGLTMRDIDGKALRVDPSK